MLNIPVERLCFYTRQVHVDFGTNVLKGNDKVIKNVQ